MEEENFGSYEEYNEEADELKKIRDRVKSKEKNTISAKRLYDMLLVLELMGSGDEFKNNLKSYNNTLDKLNVITDIFIETDELEKCSRIKRWKELLN